MKRVLFTMFCTLFCLQIFAQIRVSGNISDVAGNPLPGAIVTVYNNDKVVSYSIAQGNGAYDLKIPGSFTTLDFYLMGYRRASFKVDMKGASSMVKDVKLEEDNFQLPTITVKPVAVKVDGDTVTYDATTFVRKEDNSLQEVLNRLPHVKVTTAGQVKVQGVNVNKVYIEDMDLLGGRYGLAIKNIRPEDISAVSVYYEHQPIRALEGLVKSNQAALNIKLKEKAKNRWIWSLGGHIGLPDILYQGKVTAMNFGSGRQTMAIAKTDNSGEDIIMETRAQNLQPGAYRLSEIQGGGLEDMFPVSGVNLPVPKNYYYKNKSNAVSVNNLNKLTEDATLRENVVFFSDITGDQVYTRTVVTPENSAPVVIADSMLRKRSDKQLEGEITYTFNSREKYVENTLSVNALFNEAGSVRKSPYGGYVQDYSLPKFILEDKLQIVGKKNSRTWKLNVDLHYSRQNQSMVVLSDNISSLFGRNEVVQDFFTDNARANVYSSFTRQRGKGTFSFTPGVKMEYNGYESVITPHIDSMYNNLHLFTVQPYVDVSYFLKYRKTKIDFDAPLAIRGDFLDGDNRMYFIYAPAVSAGYDLSSSLELKGRASISNTVGGVGTMGKGYIYTGYRNLYKYDAVPERISQFYNLSLSHSSFSSMIFSNLNVSYNVFHSSVAQQEMYLQDYTFITYIDEGTAHRVFSVGANVKKLFGSVFSLKGGFEYSLNQAEQYLQGEYYKYDTEGINASADMEFTPSDKFSAVCSGSYTHSIFKSGKSQGIDHITAKATVNWFPIEKLLLKGELYHYWQTSRDERYEDISLPFLDFRVEYNFGAKMKVYVLLRNVLDTKEYNYTYFSGASTVSKVTVLRGAEYLAGFTFSL